MNAFRSSLISFLALALPVAASADGAFALAVLKSDAGIEAKARACQELAIHADARALPVLAALLSDEGLASYARTALEAMDDPAAAEALRSALPVLEGDLLVGAVTSIGVKGDENAVPALARFASDANGVAAEAALVALAQIGTEEAADAIMSVLKDGSASLRLSAAHAALLAADRSATSGNRKLARKLAKAVRAAEVPEHVRLAARGLRGS